MKIKYILAFLLTALCSSVFCAGANLLPNPGFASKDGHFPNGWNGYRGKEGISAYTTKDGVFKISGKTPTYAAYAGTSVKVEPGKNAETSPEH